jgi:hypothetical protein
MRELPMSGKVNCEQFLNEMEALPADAARGATAEQWLSALPEAVSQHAAHCAECQAAVQDFATTRRALERMHESLAEAGPWFTKRVMNAIVAQETEMEEKETGFWTSVRRLAPRMVAFATLVLMLGGTWAFEQHRAARAPGPQVITPEGIFETVPSTPANDDVVAINYEEHQP